MPYELINNTKIFYELSGKASGETILFLHGLGSSTRDWETQIPAFAPEYHVMTIDMRGHGQSDKPRDAYSMPLFASDVKELLHRLGIEKVHLVGLSMGGMIAFQLAVDSQELIQSMTIINSGPAVTVKTFKDRLSIWLRFLIVRFMGMQKMGETLAPRLFVEPEQDNLRQMFIQRWAENDPQAYMNAMRAIVGWDVEHQIHDINIPALIIASDKDYTPVSAKESYVKKMPDATLHVIENAHHAVPIEHPDIVNDAVMRFIKTHST